MVTRIISGAQTGADRAGIDAGRDLGLATGGWIPKGRRTDEGPLSVDLANAYGLKETNEVTYPPRTAMNVRDSDGTVLFGHMHSPGCSLTIKLCGQAKKPFITNPSAADLREWIESKRIKVLNVAGNRERTNPGIYVHTHNVLMEALQP